MSINTNIVLITRRITVSNYQEKINKELCPWPLDDKNLRANERLRLVLISPDDVDNCRHLLDRDEADRIKNGTDDFPVPAEYKHWSGSTEELSQKLVEDAWLYTKCPIGSHERDIVLDVQEKIGYEFANEWLIIQAFTRRSFGKEDLGIYGQHDPEDWHQDENYEAMELIGDTLITTSLYKLMFDEFSGHRFTILTHRDTISAPGTEGHMTSQKEKFADKTYLAECCMLFGFDRYIRAGKGDDISGMSPKEDVIEALVGAVAIDSGWDMKTIAGVVETLLEPQFENGDEYEAYGDSEDAFNAFNRWYQKRYGTKPVFKTYPYSEEKESDLIGEQVSSWKVDDDLSTRFRDPNGEDVIATVDIPDFGMIIGYGITKSDARSDAAEAARDALKCGGRWQDGLKDCGFEPNLNDSINQLQELYQKKYLRVKPRYEFEEFDSLSFGGETTWTCTVYIGEDCDIDRLRLPGKTKTEAKKRAAFVALVQFFKEGGVHKKEWDEVIHAFMPQWEVWDDEWYERHGDELKIFIHKMTTMYGYLPIERISDFWEIRTGEKLEYHQIAQCNRDVDLRFNAVVDSYIDEREENAIINAQKKYGLYIPTKDEIAEIREFGYIKTDASRKLEKKLEEEGWLEPVDVINTVFDVWMDINEGGDLDSMKDVFENDTELDVEEYEGLLEEMYREMRIRSLAGYSRKEVK